MKKQKIPPSLKPGSRIGIVSPSAGVTSAVQLQLYAGVSYLKDQGYEVVEGAFLEKGNGKQRAEDIHRFFLDSSIQAIIATQGGDNSQELLDYLDFHLIETHPKIFMGFSDISVLLNAITLNTGLITYHGPDVAWGLSIDRGKFTERAFHTMLTDTSGAAICSRSQHQWWKKGEGEGILLGGNLRCFLKLKEDAFMKNIDTGIIFFWEDVHGNAQQAHDYLSALLDKQFFNAVQGMIVGYLHDYGPIEAIKEMLLRLFSNVHFPILFTQDFGHKCENTVIPIGGRAILSDVHDSFSSV